MPKDIKFEGKIYRVPDDATPDEIESIVGGKSTSTTAAPAAPEPSLLSKVGTGLSNFNKGFGSAVGEFVQTGGQWLENALGMPVSPPRTTATGKDVFEQDTMSGNAGKMLGKAALAVAGGAAGGPTLAGGVAAGGLSGALQNPDAPAVPAAIGMAVPIAGKVISEGVSAVNNRLRDKETAEKIWNSVARVRGGRQGSQLDLPTGEFKTLPGRSMTDRTESPIANTMKAFFAKPNAKTQAEAYSQLSNAGKDLGTSLAQVQTPIDVVSDLPIELSKVQEAMADAGVALKSQLTAGQSIGGGLNATPQTVQTLAVSPTKAHALRSALGERINWNPAVVNDANEAMKEAYFAIGKKLDSVLPDSIKPLLKNWQESFLFNKALQGTMEKAASAPALSPTAKKILGGAALVGGGAGAHKAWEIFKP